MSAPYYVSIPSAAPFGKCDMAEAPTIEIARQMAMQSGGHIYDDTLCPVRVDRAFHDELGNEVAGAKQPGCAAWGTSTAGLQVPTSRKP